MAQKQTVHSENTHVRAPVYLEATWISPNEPHRTPFTSVAGGGGPGYGGWGLDAGRPRGTGGPSRFAREKGWRTVFGEEHKAVNNGYALQYAPAMQQLPAQIEAERAAIQQQASTTATSPTQLIELKQQLTMANLQRWRSDYLQIVPAAVGFYGAIPFFKRYDSFASRLGDDGAFDFSTTPEEWGRKIWVTFDASVNAAYRLHLLAEKYRALAADLPDLARQLDKAELEQPHVDLPKAIERRIRQIQLEQQICFDCLPNFVQHQVVQATSIQDTDTLPQRLSAYLNTANGLIEAKKAQVPAFSESNPNIIGPLSKPQTEALQHLVDEQATRRAGQLWADYHRALALTESIRYMQGFSAAMGNLAQRAIEVEQLQARHAAAHAERQRQEAARQRISYISDARTASSVPTITPIGAATFALAESASTAMLEAIKAAVARMGTVAVAAAPQFIVTTLAAAWPSTLGNADRRYLVSTPLSSLSPPAGPDLTALAMSSASVDVPYLLAGNEDDDEVRLYVVPGGKPIGVRAATFDSARQVYSLVLDNPQRILTWTPIRAPGGESGSSTSLPPAPPGTIIYTGSSLSPVSNETESYPALDLLDQERLIITFPIDSGLPPILVVFKSPRYEPGTATGIGIQVTGPWLADGTRENGAPIPAHIADLLRGAEYRNFDGFRRKFWKAIANDSELSKQFDERSLRRMRKNGNAPAVDDSDIYMSQLTYVLHHTTPISEGGGVYDMDNIKIVTPAAHNKIHYGDNQ
ncbi:S-type pyocin domain-containing protein [Pseudomonas sp. p106]|uniref:S-type pyocin domain-containing protein n=1 Tax=Pseudomonas sp. p106 TaxID=2479854 RepID=UPI000F7702EC|nr:S-type pyocin domain-containing protein [Pseudomonas sp. p106]RRV46204.1 pyocin [Pseudomonas sp. p106]